MSDETGRTMSALIAVISLFLSAVLLLADSLPLISTVVAGLVVGVWSFVLIFTRTAAAHVHAPSAGGS
jgi:hypothetical protein